VCPKRVNTFLSCLTSFYQNLRSIAVKQM